MTEQEIKLIAAFDGWEEAPNVINGSKVSWVRKTSFGTDYATVDMLRYDKDWNLLMPVIAKINYETHAYNERLWRHIKDGLSHQKINDTFHSVIAFLTWYKSIQCTN